MKQFLDLKNEYILDVKLNQVLIDGQPDWVDKEKGTCRCKQEIIEITTYIPDYDHQGYATGHYHRITLDKDDILKLADTIRETEGVMVAGIPDDQLPW